MHQNILFLLSLVIVLGSICQWLAWKVKLPAIVFLLLTGILLGPVSGILQPDILLGDLLFPFISLSVAVILFEGSLTLKYREILGLESVVRNLVTMGMGVTWIISTVAAHYALDFTWQIAFLFGAITVVTGPTVIVPLLRTVRPRGNVANILRWEGIVIDPIGASLAVLVYTFIISVGEQHAWEHTLQVFGRIVGVGLSIGALSGFLFGLILRNHWLPEFLQNFITLALVCGVFTASNMLQHESGLITVTVMGIWLANMRDVNMEEILDFKESLSILLISLLFIILAARIDFETIKALGLPAIYVLIVIQFLARPLSVMASTIFSSLSWPERFLLAWIAPRGIVAAAVSALFAIRLAEVGFQEAYLLVPLTFLVIVSTVLLQSTTARPIARWLRVAEPEPRGFLIIGANVVARTIGQALLKNDFPVLLVDTSWNKISKANLKGLPAYFGNPMSVHAENYLNLVGTGHMLGLSPFESLNMAAVMHFRMELGSKNMYMLPAKPDEHKTDKQKVPLPRKGWTLFGKDVNYALLSAMITEGAEVHATNLTETFLFDDFKKMHGYRALPLFAIDERKKIHIFTAEHQPEPKAGWVLISLISPDKTEEHKSL